MRSLRLGRVRNQRPKTANSRVNPAFPARSRRTAKTKRTKLITAYVAAIDVGGMIFRLEVPSAPGEGAFEAKNHAEATGFPT